MPAYFNGRVMVILGTQGVFVVGNPEPTLSAFDYSGRPLFRKPLPVVDRKLTRRHLALALEEILGAVPEDRRQRIHREWAEMELPDQLPPFSRSFFSLDDRLWIKQYSAPGDDSQDWMILSEEGIVRGKLTVPMEFELKDSKGHEVVGVWTDPTTHIQTIRVYHLEGAEP